MPNYEEDQISYKSSLAPDWLLASIISSSEDAIITKDLHGIITSWNDSAAKMFGYRKEEVIGQPITILIPEVHLDEETDILKKIGQGESIRSEEHTSELQSRENLVCRLLLE